MTGQIIVVLLALSVVVRAGPFFNATIGPYAICDNKAANIEPILQECYDRCRKPPQPKRSFKITIHQSDVKNGGPAVIECKKIEMEQVFTKTWLFSTSKSEPRVTTSPASETECQETINRNCPSLDCNIREPHNLEEEYHYASETTVSKTFITAISMPSSLTTDGPDIQIIPLSSERAFSMSAGKGTSNVGVYIWKPKDYSDACPFTPATTYGCDYYDNVDADKHFVCARGGFALTHRRKLKDSFPKCGELIISSEGIIYDISDADDLNIWSQRIGLTNTQYKQEDTESFRSKMNHVLANLDSDVCMMHCEMLSLESRIKRDTPKLLKIGSYMILLEPNGTGIACRPAYGCRLAKPHLLCGSPPKMGLDCTSASGYWDPTLPYMISSDVCRKPKPTEKMVFTASHHQYILDDNLVALVPSGFMHGRPADLFSSDHLEGLQFKREDLDDLRASWTNAKATGNVDSKDVASRTSIDAPTWTTDLLSLPGTIAHYLAHQFKDVLVFVTITLILITTTYWLLRSMFRSHQRVAYHATVPMTEMNQESTPAVRWI